MKKKILKVVLLSILFIPNAFAACSFSSDGMNFGVYRSPLQTSDILSSAVINLSCDNTSIGNSASIQVSSGQSGSFASRYLTNGKESLFYNLYTSSSRDAGSVLGDGTGPSKSISWTTQSTDKVTIFGKIPKNQNVGPGAYSDSLQVTLVF